MDTRTKILSETVALETVRGMSISAVTGFFDVLLTAHVRALRELAEGKRKLVAIVLNPADPLLPQAARAELAAALAMIDYVVAVPDDGTELLRNMRPAQIFRMEANDERYRLELIEHVQRRCQS